MTIVQRIRVPTGMAFALTFLYFSHPRQDLFLAGLGPALAGLGVRIWAAGHIEKGSQLAASGPYQRTRNPLYFGSFLIGLGFTLASAQGLGREDDSAVIKVYPGLTLPGTAANDAGFGNGAGPDLDGGPNDHGGA